MTRLTLTGRTRAAFLCFFGSHIPITLLIDGQAVLPPSLYPRPLRDLLAWYASAFRDGLMTPGSHPPWFRSLVACEVLLQLPFFVYATRVIWNRGGGGGGGGGGGAFRPLCVAYGSHTATTLIPIMATVASDGTTTMGEKVVLLGLYLPYLIFPLWLALVAAGGFGGGFESEWGGAEAVEKERPGMKGIKGA